MKNTKQTEIDRLHLQAEKIRKRAVEMIYSANSGHTGGSLSSIGIETVLYFYVMNIDPRKPKMEDRDRFILSKGHSVEALYSVLSVAGFFDDSILNTYGQFDSVLAGHPVNKIPGIEVNSGALGHGLSFGVGVALAAKMNKKSYRTFVLIGDGELAEGSIYEAAMAANHYKLDNLITILDRNELQISGRTEEVMTLEPIDKKWESFGWEIYHASGNIIEDLVNIFSNLNYNNKKPKLIIAHTTKGEGISFMEKNPKWHHGVPSEEQYHEAIKEIDDRIKSLTEKKYEFNKQ